MVDKPDSGELLGVPYNFERPNLRRLISAYWQPGEGMLVEKPFGIGFTLNLANWRSWILLLIAGTLLYQERQSQTEGRDEEDEGPVEVVVDD